MEVKVVGGPCGFHGPYTFYKGLKIISTQSSSQVNQQQHQQQQHNNNNNNNNSSSNNNISNNNNNSVEISNNNSGSKLTRKFSSDNIKYSSSSSSSSSNNINNSDIGDNNGGGITTTKSAKKPLIFALGDCIPVRPWSDSPIACLAELRMVWKDKNEQCLLTGLRLFFLPENTPLGRNCHGEDEVIAISDKVIIRADDLITWIDNEAEWNWGLEAIYTGGAKNNPIIPNQSNRYLLRNSLLDFTDVELEKQFEQNRRTNVAVLSYSRYCRYRATVKRLENITDDQCKNTLIDALSGFSPTCPNTRIMFCKDTFDYPELETHDLLCNHLAPKLKGRPRGRRKPTRSENSPGKPRSPSFSDSNESEESECSVLLRNKPELNQRHNHRPARTKTKSECSETTFVAAGPSPKPRKPIKLTVRGTSTKNMMIVKSDEDEEENLVEETKKAREEPEENKSTVEKQAEIVAPEVQSIPTIRTEAEQTAGLSLAKIDERNFLKKLHEFMSERLTPIPKVIWISLKDVNLHAIYYRVQELGGYDKLKDPKDWENLFVGSSTPEQNTITSKKYQRVLLPFERNERGVVEKDEEVEKEEEPKKSEPELIPVIKEEKPAEVEVEVEPPKVEVFAVTEDIEMDSEVEKILIKTEDSEECVADPDVKEAELTVEQMKEIQMKVKSKESNVVTTTTTTTTTNHVLNVPPVTVIVGGDAGKSETNPSTSKIQIQQPHTTITVHQTTIHPQMSPKSNNQNQPIQITNQIQIQQITVQPNNEVNQTSFNITQDKMGQEIQISPSTNGDYCKVLNRQSSSGDEMNSSKKVSSLRHVRVKNKDNLNGFSPNRNTDITTNKIDSHIPLILSQKMTTITPILGSNSISSQDRDGNLGKRQKSPEIIELLDSDNENSNPKHIKMCPPVKKRKLEILREGGLEVTPIHHGAPVPVRKPDTPPSFEVTTKKLMLPTPSAPKVVPRLNEPPKTTPSPIIPNMNVPTPPKPLFQSHCMFKSSNRIFGNPKDVLQPQAITSKPINPVSTYVKKENGIIDLTSVSPNEKDLSVEIKKNPSVPPPPPPSKKPVLSHSISLHLKPSPINRDLLSSLGEKNLRTKTKLEPPQISLIPQQKLTHVQHIHNSQNHNIKRNLLTEPEVKKKSNVILPPPPPPPPPPITIPKPTQSPSIPPPSFNTHASIPTSTPSNNSNIIPPPPAAYFPSLSQLPQMHSQTSTNHYSPFLPLLDPLYLSSLYASRGILFPPAPHVSPEFLQYYTKNMAAAQGNGLPITKS